ncbi:MAG: hypothetical protein ACTSVU_07065 [Promethearchaeota archaeon]
MVKLVPICMSVEGGLIIGYCNNSGQKINGLTWTMRLVLSSGEVDLAEQAIEVSVYVANKNVSRGEFDENLTDYTDFYDDNVSTGTYGMTFYDEVHANTVLDPGELVKFYVKLDDLHQISASDKVMIVIISSVAMMRITKNAPTAIITGVNVMR